MKKVEYIKPYTGELARQIEAEVSHQSEPFSQSKDMNYSKLYSLDQNWSQCPPRQQDWERTKKIG